MPATDKLQVRLSQLDEITARMDEVERMIYGSGSDDAMPYGDRRDSLEAEYDELMDQLFNMNNAAA